jgi:ParB family chromosome partitioning protein
MTRRRGLGKGLDALIPSEEPERGPGVQEVALELIRPNPRQPRRAVDAEALRELADSIREHGVLQPLIVSPEPFGDGFALVAGARRLEAARLVGLTTVPVIVRITDEQLRLELALIENLQRADLSPLEAADGYRQLTEDFGLSHEEVAARVGKSRAAITNTLRLLRLAPAARQALGEGAITEGHARALLSLSSSQAQSAALQTVLNRGLSVRQTEELVRRMAGERKAPPRRRSRPPEESDLEGRLRQALGTRVSLVRGRHGGRLVIHFYSDEELNALVDQILGHSRR